MKHTFSLVLAVLLGAALLTACSLFQEENPYHWTPPEKKLHPMTSLPTIPQAA